MLPRLQPRAATELYLTGDTFDGRRAEEIGLVTAARPAEALDATVAAYCTSLVRGAPGALAGAKGLLRRPAGTDFRAELAELTELSTGYFRSEEGREGVPRVPRETARALGPARLTGLRRRASGGSPGTGHSTYADARSDRR